MDATAWKACVLVLACGAALAGCNRPAETDDRAAAAQIKKANPQADEPARGNRDPRPAHYSEYPVDPCVLKVGALLVYLSLLASIPSARGQAPIGMIRLHVQRESMPVRAATVTPPPTSLASYWQSVVTPAR